MKRKISNLTGICILMLLLFTSPVLAQSDDDIVYLYPEYNPLTENQGSIGDGFNYFSEEECYQADGTNILFTTSSREHDHIGQFN